eukprot:6182600-Pleurochrysis_carterae.AAC.2
MRRRRLGADNQTCIVRQEDMQQQGKGSSAPESSDVLRQTADGSLERSSWSCRSWQVPKRPRSKAKT